MYIETSKSVQCGKTYYRHLLRENYRENGKIKHRTLVNLSALSDEVIAAMKLALKYKDDLSALVDVKEIEATISSIRQRWSFRSGLPIPEPPLHRNLSLISITSAFSPALKSPSGTILTSLLSLIRM